MDTTNGTKMIFFVIGNDNAEDGALFPIGYDFYNHFHNKLLKSDWTRPSVQIRKINSDWLNPHIRVEDTSHS